MDENHNSIETQPSWFAPWRWHRGLWIAALIVWPPFYLLSVLMMEHCVGKEPGWPRTVVSIINSPLEPVREPFRRTATVPNRLYIPSNCDVCGEVAIFRFRERVSNDPPDMRLRHSPADALKPDIAR